VTALTSLLARDGVVPVRKIEEALQRQVISGGEVDTVLLELDALPENQLNAYCAALHGMAPASRADVMQAPATALALLPAEVAREHLVVPLAESSGTVDVAAAQPLPSPALQELGSLLGAEIRVRLVSTPRLLAGLAVHYGHPLSARMERLWRRLDKRDPGSLPAQLGGKARFSLPELPAKKRPSLPPEELDRWSGGEGSTEAAAPAFPTTPVVRTVVLGRGEGPAAPPEAPRSGSRTQKMRPVAHFTPTLTPAAPFAPSADAPEADPTPTSVAEAPAAPERSATPTRPGLSTVRGRITVDAGQAMLEGAEDRDGVLSVLFSFARQFFDYTALFTLHDDIADGREADGAGAPTEVVQQLSIPLDGSSVFQDCVRSLGPRVVTPGDGVEAKVLAELRRPPATRFFVMPVSIRNRPVMLLYGDRSDEVLQLDDVLDLVRFVPRVGEAFERLILRNKRPVKPRRGDRDRGLKDAAQVVALTAGTDRLASRRRRSSGGWEAGGERTRRASAGGLGTWRSVENAPQPLSTEAAPSDASVPAARPGASPPEPPRTGPPSAVLGIDRRSPPPPPRFEADPRPEEEDDEPALLFEVGADEEDDDEPELTFETSDAEDEDFEGLEDLMEGAESPRSTYSVRIVPVDVVRPPDERNGAPPRADPRREGEADRPPEVVRLPAEAPAPARPMQALDADTRSVIVDMGDQVHTQVDELLSTSSRQEEDDAIRALLRLGEAALPGLVQAFPGPLRHDRRRDRRVPRGREVSPVARALVAFGDLAVPYVASLLSSGHPDTRYYAALVASELVHPGLLEPVAERVFDDDLDVRRAANALLPRFEGMEGFAKVKKMLRRVGRIRGKDLRRRHRAVDALAALRDVDVLPRLIELLDETDDRELVDRVHRALVILTAADQGRARHRWQRWWGRHEHQHRVEWLIDGLLHDDEALRHAASEELKRITREYFGFHPGSSRRDRERVHRRYRHWWETEGREKFLG
jgi:hypothetical protein